MGASITGWGSALPLAVRTNEDLADELGVQSSWIEGRTGVRSRYIAGPSETTATLASQACAHALKVADVIASEVDMVIVATSTPDYQLPSTASLVQGELGCTQAGGFDLGAACTGFLYGLEQARVLIESGSADTVLVAGAETLSRITDYSDPRSCVLFGDGAGAVVVQASGSAGIEPLRFATDVGFEELLYVRPDERLIRMQGREVYRHAVEAMTESLQELFDIAGITNADVDLIIAHQANGRILEAVADRLGTDGTRMAMHIAEVGNTSAASVPLALVDAVENDRLHDGDLIALTAFGAGFTWGAGLVRWGAKDDQPVALTGFPALVGTAGHLLEIR